MSFSSEQKNEIIKQQYKNTCCRNALIKGILSSKARIVSKRIKINLENLEYAEFAAKLIQEFYGKNAEILPPEKGGRCKVLSFESNAAEKYLNQLSIDNTVFFKNLCPNCKSAFFRGFFVACGRVSDPKKQYHLEFSPLSHCEKFKEILLESDIETKLSQRGDYSILYSKKSSMLEDFFALIGINNAAFALMNAKIEGEIRNNANRIFNCDTNNIDKSVRASYKQIKIIEKLQELNLLSSLPEELEATAKLRMSYKDLSLSQLAAVSVPPISKSGLSHRLNRIIEISEHLLDEN